MPTDAIKIETLNFNEVAQAFEDAPELASAYLKREMHRAAARVRKRFMEQRMHGPPGIRGGEWLKQHKRHIKYWTIGRDLGSLQSAIRIGRFLTPHEFGGTVTAQHKGRDMLRIPIGPRRKLPTRGGFEGNHIKGLVFIRRKGKSPLLAEIVGGKMIPRFVLKGRIVMKARLGFAQTVMNEWPKEFPKLQETLHRAVRVSLERRMRAISEFAQRVTSL